MHLPIENSFIFVLFTVAVSASSESDGIIGRSGREVVVVREKIPDEAPVVRGIDARKGEWTSHVYVELGNGQNRCGGSVLNEWWVLTAAHCLNRYKPTKVIAGTIRLKSLDPGSMVSTVENSTCHEDFKIGYFDNDICLLKLSTPLRFGVSISAVTLPPSNSRPTALMRCQVAGWGLNERGELPDNLQEATVTVFEQAECQERYGSFVVPKSHFCAGHIGQGPGPDTCGGDSGGPLICLVNEKLVLHGITSFGPRNCGNDRRPGAYTRVVDYLEWIKDKTTTYRWGPWIDSSCSVTCGTGIKKMERKCIGSDGQTTSDSNKCSPGLAVKEETCTKEDCTQSDGIIGISDREVVVVREKIPNEALVGYHWGEWEPSPCSASCGQGHRRQVRRCLDENNYIVNNENCQPGIDTQVKPCTGGECVASPSSFWGKWGHWSSCRVSFFDPDPCNGFRSRIRSCLNKWKQEVASPDCVVKGSSNDENYSSESCSPDNCNKLLEETQDRDEK